MPTASLTVGILSVVLATIALTRPRTLAQRVYYEDGQYLVSVRYGQWHDLREFVTPEDPAVLAVCSQVGQDAWQLFDFVCREISYRSDIGEFWQLPFETLARQRGDCDDSAILLTSLLRAGRMSAYAVLGDYQGYGHAWCEHRGQLMETTFTSARPVPDPQDYTPLVLFDDQEVIELYPGALQEVLSLRRDEATKLNLMARVLNEKI